MGFWHSSAMACDITVGWWAIGQKLLIFDPRVIIYIPLNCAFLENLAVVFVRIQNSSLTGRVRNARTVSTLTDTGGRQGGQAWNRNKSQGNQKKGGYQHGGQKDNNGSKCTYCSKKGHRRGNRFAKVASSGVSESLSFSENNNPFPLIYR